MALVPAATITVNPSRNASAGLTHQYRTGRTSRKNVLVPNTDTSSITGLTTSGQP
ncbi:hypothetical protein [Nonomuraea salmonea]|uniref:hypothetical protein n=1 Tax=Nonomuraea salmonea TaxID=46181 RepID=UPI0031E9C085